MIKQVHNIFDKGFKYISGKSLDFTPDNHTGASLYITMIGLLVQLY